MNPVTIRLCEKVRPDYLMMERVDGLCPWCLGPLADHPEVVLNPSDALLANPLKT